MRIAFVTPEFVTEQTTFDGGLSNYLYKVCIALLQMGHQPTVFVSSDRDERITHDGIEVYRVNINYNNRWFNLLRFLHKGNVSLPAIWKYIGAQLNKKLAAVHSQQKFDVIQYSSHGAMAYHRIPNVPTIVRVSSYEPLHRIARGVTEPSREDIVVEKLEHEAMLKADALFGPSRITAEAVAKATGREVKVIQTPFVMDIGKLDPSVYNQNLAGKKYLLYFGTLSRLKGMLNIAAITYQLLEQNPELHLVFVGKVEGQMLELVREKAKQHSDRIIWLDRMPHSQLYPIIQHAFAVVSPSLYDNFPNTCIEAMSQSRIVVGTKGTSFEEVITDGKNGFLCEKDNSDSLLATVIKVLNLDESERQKVEAAAAATAQELRPEIVVQKLVEFYTQVISG